MLSKFPTVDPNPDDDKKCVAVRLGVIYDSQATHREQGVSRTPIGWPNYTKNHHKKVEALTFCLKNCLKQNFVD